MPVDTKTFSKPASPSFQPKSEVWIQHELDVASLNAEKNRSIQDGAHDRVTRPHSESKKSVLKSTSDMHRADQRITRRPKSVTLSVSQKSSNKPHESSTNNQGYPLISKQILVEEHNKGINLLPFQIQNVLDEWSCAIKQAIFHDDMGLNVNIRHAPQDLVLM